MAAVAGWNANFSGDSTPERVQGIQATDTFFQTLGARTDIGRTFSPSDTVSGSPRVVVLSHGFWKRHFGSDPEVLGRSIRLNGDTYSVIGVLPTDFVFRSAQWDVIVPLLFADDPRHDQRADNFLRTFGRLKDGTTIGQASADLGGIVRRLQRDYPKTNAGKPDVRLELLLGSIVGNVRTGMTLILAAVSSVLLIACANLACLMLVRASGRSKEIAVRISLGAPRSRLVRQLLTETLIMSILGGAAGILLAAGGTHALSALLPAAIPRTEGIHVDSRVVLFATALSLFCGCLFGLAPIRELSRTSLNDEMKQGGRSVSGSQASRALRQSLVIAQVAASLTLLLGTLLLLKSFVYLAHVNPGFNPSNVLVVRLALPKYSYSDGDRILHFYEHLAEKAEALPGVKSVAVANVVPTDGFLASVNFNIVGRSWAPDQYPEAHYRMVTPKYFRTMEIPIRSGRDFSVSDRAEGAPVAIINQAFAHKYWPENNPVGDHLQMDDTQGALREVEIIGIVGDIHDFGLENASPAEVYVPITQVPPQTIGYLRNNMCWFLRSSIAPSNIAASFREQVALVDPDVPSASVRTLEQYLEQSMAPRRFNLSVTSLFGLLALAFTVLGVYALISYSVLQRTGEIGIRMALGAQRSQVFGLVIREGLKPVGLGIACGVIPAFLVTRWIQSMLYGVNLKSPAIYVGTGAIVLCAALLACYLPARRAIQIDPVGALRQE